MPHSTTKKSPELAIRSTGQPRSQCIAVCLHIHHIHGLPPSDNGKVIAVGWKIAKGRSKVEKTRLVKVSQGAAFFNEVFLSYCRGVDDDRSALKSIDLSVVDAANRSVGRFRIDVSEVGLAEDLNLSSGGKLVSLELEGVGNGGVLSVGVYCRMLDQEEASAANFHDSCLQNDESKKERKSKCFSCLNFKLKLRIRAHVVALARRTGNNSSTRKHDHVEDVEDDCEAFHARTRHPPSDDLRNSDEEEDLEEEDEQLYDMNELEDEFLRMLEEKKCLKRAKAKAKNVISRRVSLDFDSLMEEAEMELNRAVGGWRSRAEGGALIERKEYEELVKKWGAKEINYANNLGFGGPFRDCD